jgi:hypothetical protein
MSTTGSAASLSSARPCGVLKTLVRPWMYVHRRHHHRVQRLAEDAVAEDGLQRLAKLAPAVLRARHRAAEVHQARHRPAGQRPAREHARPLREDEVHHALHRHLEGQRHAQQRADGGAGQQPEAAPQRPARARLQAASTVEGYSPRKPPPGSASTRSGSAALVGTASGPEGMLLRLMGRPCARRAAG